MTTRNQTAQFAARELGLSQVDITVDSKPWSLVGSQDSDGIVRTYELSKGDAVPCVKIHLSLARSFIVEKISYPKSIDLVIDGEIVYSDRGKPERVKVMVERSELKNPRLLLKVLRLIFTTKWALDAAKNGEVTSHYLACSCITNELGLELMSDRQMLQGFENATDDQLIRAEQRYLELEPQLTLVKASDVKTVTVHAIESSKEEIKLDPAIESPEEIKPDPKPPKTPKTPKFIQGETLIYTASDAHEMLKQSEELITA